MKSGGPIPFLKVPSNNLWGEGRFYLVKDCQSLSESHFQPSSSPEAGSKSDKKPLPSSGYHFLRPEKPEYEGGVYFVENHSLRSVHFDNNDRL
jgi:hypothetical protein